MMRWKRCLCAAVVLATAAGRLHAVPGDWLDHFPDSDWARWLAYQASRDAASHFSGDSSLQNPFTKPVISPAERDLRDAVGDWKSSLESKSRSRSVPSGANGSTSAPARESGGLLGAVSDGFVFAPHVGFRGPAKPFVDAKSEMSLAGLRFSAFGMSEPVSERQTLRFGVERGGLRLEAASRTGEAPSMGGRLSLLNSSLWSRYVPRSRAVEVGLSRPVTTGLTLDTRLSEDALDRRAMVNFNFDSPSAFWNVMRSVVR